MSQLWWSKMNHGMSHCMIWPTEKGIELIGPIRRRDSTYGPTGKGYLANKWQRWDDLSEWFELSLIYPMSYHLDPFRWCKKIHILSNLLTQIWKPHRNSLFIFLETIGFPYQCYFSPGVFFLSMDLRCQHMIRGQKKCSPEMGNLPRKMGYRGSNMRWCCLQM